MAQSYRVELGNIFALEPDYAVVLGFPDNVPADSEYSQIFFLDLQGRAAWAHRNWPAHTAVSACRVRRAADGEPATAILGRGGTVRFLGAGRDMEETIEGPRSLNRGDLTHIAEIGADLFACGAYGQVYRRDGGAWRLVSPELAAFGDEVRRRKLDRLTQGDRAGDLLAVVADEAKVATFTAIAGLSETDVYACGMAGHLHHYDGASWTRLDTGTDAHLLDLDCAPNGEVAVCGYDGTLLVGSAAGGFRPTTDGPGRLIFWSVARFDGTLHVGTLEGLRRVVDGATELVVDFRAGLGPNTPLQRIDAAGEAVLWMVDDRRAYRMTRDGVERHEHPDNG